MMVEQQSGWMFVMKFKEKVINGLRYRAIDIMNMLLIHLNIVILSLKKGKGMLNKLNIFVSARTTSASQVMILVPRCQHQACVN